MPPWPRAENADNETPQAEPELPGFHRDMVELAHRIEEVPLEHLGLLQGLLCRAGRDDYAEILEDLELRQRLIRKMGLLPMLVLALAGIGLLVAVFMQVGWLASHASLGFGVLGVLMLVWGLRGWYRGREIGDRIATVELRAALEERDAILAEVEGRQVPRGRQGRRRR